MVEDKILNAIADGIINYEYDEPTRSDTPLKYYTELFFTNIENNNRKLRKYIENVIDSQSSYVVDCVENRRTAIIPLLGTFRLKSNIVYKKEQLEKLSPDLTKEEKDAIIIDKLRKLKIASNPKAIHNNIYKNMLNSIKNTTRYKNI